MRDEEDEYAVSSLGTFDNAKMPVLFIYRRGFRGGGIIAGDSCFSIVSV